MAGAKTLRFDTDADFELGVRWKGADGVPYELSELRFAAATEPDAILADSSAGVELGTAPEHWATIIIPAADLADLVPGEAKFDIIATRASDGRRRKLLEGSVVVKAGAVPQP